ncbi:MAG: hypothetical protein JKX72_07895, partial [Robiginitomaculum sp.]|nr:hypothetical protein [Robiginitomaculum sp.]
SHEEAGIGFGALSDLSDPKPATLAHHISKMQAGGIIKSKQIGNGTVFTANLTTLRASFDTVLKVT